MATAFLGMLFISLLGATFFSVDGDEDVDGVERGDGDSISETSEETTDLLSFLESGGEGVGLDLETTDGSENDGDHNSSTTYTHTEKYDSNDSTLLKVTQEEGQNVGVVQFTVEDHSQGKILRTDAVLKIVNGEANISLFEDPHYCLQMLRKMTNTNSIPSIEKGEDLGADEIYLHWKGTSVCSFDQCDGTSSSFSVEGAFDWHRFVHLSL